MSCRKALPIRTGLLLMSIVLVLAFAPASASAAEGPQWRIVSVSEPTNLAPGQQGHLMIWVVNVGGSSTDGSTIAITDTLPGGLTAQGISGGDMYKHQGGELGSLAGYLHLSCAASPSLGCSYTGTPVDPGDVLLIEIPVQVGAGVSQGSSLTNRVSVSGGGAPSAFVQNDVTVSSQAPPVGFAPGGSFVAASSMQAGGHANLTTMFTLNTKSEFETSGAPKDVRLDLPVGFVGNTVGMTECTMQGVMEEGTSLEGRRNVPACPSDSVVGTAVVRASDGKEFGRILSWTAKLYDIAPAPGEPAAFAFTVYPDLPVRLDTSVLSSGDYGVRVTAPDITEAGQAISTVITTWGVPADHNGPGSDIDGVYQPYIATTDPSFGGSASSARVPLLTNPSQCSEALRATWSSDPWAEPGAFREMPVPVGSFSGCGLLPFFPSVSMLPDTLQAGAPAGYSFDLKVPRADDALPEGVAASDVKTVTVALPMGTVVSPSSANGLAACSDEQFALHSGALGECPRESQVGTVKITSPNIAEPLAGEVFLGSPLCDPCSPADAQGGRMIRLFLQVKGEGEGGILVKQEGTGSINQQTGQLTTTFANAPQLPFNDLKLTLAGGPRATLANPSTCGPATTSADLTPWSSPFAPDATPTSTFEVTGCAAPRFAPSFTAGTTSNQAGGFSPFTVAFGRTDADQDLAGLQMRMPPGLLGSLSQVPLCGEPQAGQGTCGQGSLIGHVQVLTGPGAEPFLVTGGQVFLTGAYKGAPFGLSIVVPAKAGPYTLSGTTGTGIVVVRAAINVDPSTAALTVTSDPLPTILDGIPLALKVVNATIDRPGFMFNPTSCDPLQVTGTLTSPQGASAGVSSSFQVTNCGALAFKPQFLVSTSGKTSRANGASLDAKVIYPTGSQGTQANIAKVKVDLPKQLPSRLTTLQKACTAAVFEANPAGCPAASVIGIAKASTPVLPVGLSGPVYFVSHGGEAFPSLIMVLEGYGVRVNLVGATFISKAGITSSTFKTVPDVPISSFEIYLPEGLRSALAANGNLCKSKLAMPTEFVAQNGTTIHESTKIKVTGCPKAKKAKPKKKSKAKKKGKARKAAHAHVGQGRGKS